MSDVNLVETTPEAPAERGLAFRGLYEVFVAPTAFFSKLKINPKLLVPYLIIGVMALIFFLLTADLIFQMQVNNPQFQERLQGNAEFNAETAKPFVIGSTIIGGTIAMLLIPMIAAALAAFWGNFVFAGRSKFTQILSVTLYGEVLYVFGSMILTLPLILAKGSLGPSFSLAVLVADKGIESPLYVALSKLSVFNLWEIVVLGIGYSIIFGFSKGKGYATALLSVGLMSAIQIIWTAIFA